MNQELIDFIIKEVRPCYDDILRKTDDSQKAVFRQEIKDIRATVCLFLDTLAYDIKAEDLKGLGIRMTVALEDLAAERESLQYLFPALNEMEQYARKVLYITDHKHYATIKREQGGFAPVLSAIGLKAKSIQSAYDLRNWEAHACKDWTRGQYYAKILDILVACLRITYKQADNLKKNIYLPKKDITVSFTAYIHDVIEQYSPKIASIVQLESEEDTSQLDLYAIENVSEEKTARKGAVRELMASIPEKRMILWGDAGTGKTTTLEYIVYMDAKAYEANRSNPVPVLIYLGMTTDEHWTLEDYIADKLKIEMDQLKKLLETGTVRLYFDGYNEIPYTERNMLKTKRRREMTNLLVHYPNTFIALTNRPQDGKEFSGIPVFNLLEMDKQKVSEFIHKNSSSEILTQMVKEAIRQDENLAHLVKKPLILKSLLFIAKMTGKLPKREGQIIGSFLKALFEREQQEKYDEYLDEEKLNFLLRRIGYETSENNRTNSGISQKTILDIMARCEEDKHFSYDNLYALNLIVHLGIMDKRDNLYVFAHQSYQDYYAAQEELANMEL